MHNPLKSTLEHVHCTDVKWQKPARTAESYSINFSTLISKGMVASCQLRSVEAQVSDRKRRCAEQHRRNGLVPVEWLTRCDNR
eukprot:1349098-Amorphochlora_amoeboformis.AAC.2